METTDKEYTWGKRSSRRDLASVLFRRKWIIIVVFLSTVIPVTLYTFMKPATYVAASRLLVKPGRENIYVAPVGSPEGMHPPTIIQRVGELINSEIEIIKSRVLVKRVVEDIGIARVFPPTLQENCMVARGGESLPKKAMEKIGIAGVFPPTFPKNSLAQRGGE